MNFKLRLAIDRARAASVPNDNIDRAIRAGAGESKGAEIKELSYEGFGPGGVAVIAQAVTDNPNRTSADLRLLFSTHAGTLGSVNSVRWMFDVRGVIRLSLVGIPSAAREKIELGVIDAGAADVREADDELVIFTQPDQWAKVKDWLKTHGQSPTVADVELVPHTTVTVDEPTREKVHELLSKLEEHDDVTEVYSNEE